MYTNKMKFEWDRKKDKLNQIKHNISFNEATNIFKCPIFSLIDNRKEYNEIREISIGRLNNSVILIVVHTDRKNIKRIISARIANQKERRKYYEYIKKASQRN